MGDNTAHRLRRLRTALAEALEGGVSVGRVAAVFKDLCSERSVEDEFFTASVDAVASATESWVHNRTSSLHQRK